MHLCWCLWFFSLLRRCCCFLPSYERQGIVESARENERRKMQSYLNETKVHENSASHKFLDNWDRWMLSLGVFSPLFERHLGSPKVFLENRDFKIFLLKAKVFFSCESFFLHADGFLPNLRSFRKALNFFSRCTAFVSPRDRKQIHKYSPKVFVDEKTVSQIKLFEQNQ